MDDKQASRSEGLLQSSTTRVPVILLRRVEEIFPAARKSLVSVVNRRECYHVCVDLHGKREEKLSWKLMLICIFH